MRLAVTYENGEIFGHFGRTEQFKIYEIKEGQILSTEVVDTNGSGHGALAGFLLDRKVDALICGGIGGGAQTALDSVGIRIFPGVMGNADDAVAAFLSGQLMYADGATCCDHHHEEGEDCGHHEGGCGHHEGGCSAHGCH